MLALSLKTVFCCFRFFLCFVVFLLKAQQNTLKWTEINSPSVWGFMFYWLQVNLAYCVLCFRGYNFLQYLCFCLSCSFFSFSRDFLNKIWDMQFWIPPTWKDSSDMVVRCVCGETVSCGLWFGLTVLVSLCPWASPVLLSFVFSPSLSETGRRVWSWVLPFP